MKDHMKRALAWCFAVSMIVWTAGISLFLLGPRVETKVLPVIDHVQATLIDVDKEREVLHLAAYGQKVRQCEWKAITAMVHKNDKWHQGTVYFTDPRLAGQPITQVPPSRPIGAQSLGEIYVFPSGDGVRVYLWHQCHPLWQTMTFLYELDLTGSPVQIH